MEQYVYPVYAFMAWTGIIVFILCLLLPPYNFLQNIIEKEGVYFYRATFIFESLKDVKF